MTTRPPAPDYTSRDYDTMLERLKRLVQSLFPAWTDFNVADFGNTLLRTNSFVTDVLSKHTDFWARESLPTYAILRRSIVSHARWLGYTLKGRSAAQVTVSVSTLSGSPHGTNATIRAGSLFRVPSPVSPIDFQVVADTVLPAASSSVNVLLEHSENVEEEISSTGRAKQSYRLSQAPYIQGSMAIIADDGVYTEVENFLLSGSADRHFMIEVDDEEFPIISFSDGINGKIPVGTVSLSYTVGGGREGNVESGISEIIDEVIDDLGNSVALVVSQTTPAQGGDYAETVDVAKSSAPSELRVLNRTVAREDFEVQALAVSGVAACLFLTSNETLQVRENEGVGFIVARGTQLDSGNFLPAAPTRTLLQQVEAYWRENKPYMLTYRARAVGDSGNFFKTVDIEATVFLNNFADLSKETPSSPTAIGIELYQSLQDWFAIESENGERLTNVNFGFSMKRQDGTPVPEIAWSSIFNVLRDHQAVRKMEHDGLLLNGENESLSVSLYSFPILGTVEIYDGDTGGLLYP